MDMDLNDYTMRYKQGVKVVTMKEGTTWFGCLNAGGATLEAQLDGERHLVVWLRSTRALPPAWRSSPF